MCRATVPRCDCATNGEGKGTDEMDRQCTVGGLLHAHQGHNLVKCLHMSDVFYVLMTFSNSHCYIINTV